MNNTLAWRTAFLLGMGTALDISGINLLQHRDFQSDFWVESFQNVGGYLSSALENDAEQHRVLEFLEEKGTNQLELFG
jgi:hypothetical protein